MFGVRKMARVKGAEEDLLKDASESLAELTGLDQEWISVVLKHRKKQFRKLVRENACGKTVEQESGKNRLSGPRCQSFIVYCFMKDHMHRLIKPQTTLTLV